MSKKISRKKIEKARLIFVDLMNYELDEAKKADNVPAKFMHEGKVSAYSYAAITMKQLLETGEVEV